MLVNQRSFQAKKFSQLTFNILVSRTEGTCLGPFFRGSLVLILARLKTVNRETLKLGNVASPRHVIDRHPLNLRKPPFVKVSGWALATGSGFTDVFALLKAIPKRINQTSRIREILLKPRFKTPLLFGYPSAGNPIILPEIDVSLEFDFGKLTG